MTRILNAPTPDKNAACNEPTSVSWNSFDAFFVASVAREFDLPFEFQRTPFLLRFDLTAPVIRVAQPSLALYSIYNLCVRSRQVGRGARRGGARDEKERVDRKEERKDREEYS